MNWYLVKIVYRIVCGNGTHTPQFDEQLRLIHATDKMEAYTKALRIGQKESETFFNERQQLVQWEFINVSELYPLNKLIDGAEIYSRITEVDNGEAYADAIHKRAVRIKETASAHELNFL